MPEKNKINWVGVRPIADTNDDPIPIRYGGTPTLQRVQHTIATGETALYLIETSAVLSNETWFVGSICTYNATSSSTGSINLHLYDGSTEVALSVLNNPGVYVPVTYHGNLMMKEGWKVRAWYSGTTVGDSIVLDVCYTVVVLI